ncbi:MAG: HD-GYP domain-containing protein [Clostridiaceae bacterium]|jgi:HD-GYP domain-containing protein (c-di-GMP phosphodiesterase class II)|nr:HD-GYP domain-containing protein [Clostridiaceae bacterium]
MRLVALQDITGDEVLAQPIFDIDGRRLLNQGMRLKPSYLQKLHDKGVFSVYIEDEISEGIEIDDALCQQTRIEAKQVVSRELSRFARNREIHFQEIIRTVNDIVDEILSSRKDLISLKDVRQQDEYLFAHSVNVCALSIMLAAKLGYDKIKTRSIALGALLHDFGKIMIAPSLLYKEKGLSPEEILEIKKHTLYGYNMLKEDNTISPTAKIAVLMHHENLDGSGYPLGLLGDKVHYSSRIVSICNLYDRIICDRNSRITLSTADAVEQLSSSSGIHLDKSFTDEFLSMIPIFPNGTLVLLSNGLVGIVVCNNSKSLTRPVIRLLYNPKSKARYGKNYIVDLMKELSLKIVREIHIPSEVLKGST